jgi:hypothetical protein
VTETIEEFLPLRISASWNVARLYDDIDAMTHDAARHQGHAGHAASMSNDTGTTPCCAMNAGGRSLAIAILDERGVE